MRLILRALPVILLIALLVIFSSLAPHFLTLQNVAAILVQSSWLIVVGLGMNLALLSAGVDLSVGTVMYLAAVITALTPGAQTAWLGLLICVVVGTLFGALNGLLVARLRLLAFVVTLAMTFVGRGLGLFLSSTRVLYAGPALAVAGRDEFLKIPVPLWISAAAVVAALILMTQTPFGAYVRSIGADAEAAKRAGVPVTLITWLVYTLSGGFAGLGGFISFSQTSSASSAFGEKAEFLAIAAAVLGGTSLFGGRGNVWAPVVGAILIMTVQDGLIQVDANPYAYPVLTGGVILAAALIDSLRERWMKGVRWAD